MMKEVTQDQFDYQVEIVDEQQQKKEVRLIGKQRRIRGLSIWELDLKAKTLQKAKLKKEDILLTSLDPEASNKTEKHIKIETREHCIYFQALNYENALKKVGKMANQRTK